MPFQIYSTNFLEQQNGVDIFFTSEYVIQNLIISAVEGDLLWTCLLISKQERLECPKQLSVTVQALYNHKGEGYEMLNRWVLSRDRKTA